MTDEALRAALDDEQIDTVIEMGPDLFPALLQLGLEADDNLSYGASAVFSGHGEVGLAYLADQVSRGSHAAASILAKARFGDPAVAVDALRLALDAPDKDFRYLVGHALAHIGERTALPDMVPEMASRLTLPDRDDVRHALACLASLGESTPLPLSLVRPVLALTDAHTHVLTRAAAVDCLGTIGQAHHLPDEPTRQLLSLLSDGEKRVRRAAAQALAKVSEQRNLTDAVEAILCLADDEYAGARVMCIRALEAIGRQRSVPAILPVIERLARDDDARVVRTNARRALGRLVGSDREVEPRG